MEAVPVDMRDRREDYYAVYKVREFGFKCITHLHGMHEFWGCEERSAESKMIQEGMVM